MDNVERCVVCGGEATHRKGEGIKVCPDHADPGDPLLEGYTLDLDPQDLPYGVTDD